jgi:putative flavoprotein involved in K+ transport
MVRLVMRVAFHHVLTLRTPLGRAAMPKVTSRGGPLIRYRKQDVERAGVSRVPRVTGVESGLPVLADGTTLRPANVLWCTGFDDDWSWVEAPGFARPEPAAAMAAGPGAPRAAVLPAEPAGTTTLAPRRTHDSGAGHEADPEAGHGPVHVRGVVTGQPGLYLVGRHFLYAMSSAMIHGVGRDADHVAAHIAGRSA